MICYERVNTAVLKNIYIFSGFKHFISLKYVVLNLTLHFSGVYIEYGAVSATVVHSKLINKLFVKKNKLKMKN